MGRAARLKKEKRDAKRQPAFDGTIELKNPQKQNFAQFIQGNAEAWRQSVLTSLLEDGARIKEYRFWGLGDERLGPTEQLTKKQRSAVMIDRLNAIHLPVVRTIGRLRKDRGVVEENSGKGKELVICGAGPSLRRYAKEYCTPERDVWGCNSALTWLIDQGYPVTHGFSVDQTLEMLIEWKTTPDVEYLLASTVHPNLTELLTMRGRKIRYFHNYAGIPGPVVEHDGEDMGFEDWLYCVHFPSTVRTGSGLNSVNRAMDLSVFMGYDKVYVLGNDCAMDMKTLPPANAPQGSPAYMEWLAEETVMHANGDSSIHNGQSPLTLIGEIDGETFLTKPDLIVSSVWAVKQEEQSNGRLQIVGSKLIDRLRGKPDSFLKRLPTLTNNGKMLFPENSLVGAA